MSQIVTHLILIPRMPGQSRMLDFNDTFLSLDHLVQSFPQYQVEVSCVYKLHAQVYHCTLSSVLLTILRNKYLHSSKHTHSV